MSLGETLVTIILLPVEGLGVGHTIASILAIGPSCATDAVPIAPVSVAMTFARLVDVQLGSQTLC